MTVRRLRVIEYQNLSGWLRSTAESLNIGREELQTLIQQAAIRASNTLRMSEPVMNLVGDRLTVLGVSGLIQLSPSLELEIVPKFLDESSETWREDFFFLASNSTRGSVLSRDSISSSTRNHVDLASIVGRYIADEVDKRRRRPLRSYQVQEWDEWTADGDPDATNYILPNEEGFLQHGLSLTKSNDYNAIVFAAAKSLIPRVADTAVRQRLIRVCDFLGAQNNVRGGGRSQTLPGRHSQWQSVYDVSLQVLSGFGISASTGSYSSPGFVINSWRLWEDLIRRSILLRFPENATYHPIHTLGHRLGLTPVEVIPDLIMTTLKGDLLVIDAKYKGRFDSEPRISNADLYESLAFMRATNAKKTLLIFPMTEFKNVITDEVGHYVIFDKITIQGQQIVGAMISVQNISKRYGFQRFTQGLVDLVEAV